MRHFNSHFTALALLTLLAACSGDSEPDDTNNTNATNNVNAANNTDPDMAPEDMDDPDPLPTGLIAYWSFDEGSGTTASDSEGAHDATLENGAAWSAGKAGQGITFDGTDDYVNVPDHADFDFGGGDWTISAWFKTTSEKDHHIINFRQNDNDPHIELYAAPAPFGLYGTHILPGDVRINVETSVNDGAWHHAAASLENGTENGYKLYLDGVMVGETTYEGDGLADWDTIHIGAGALGERDFEGSIDEVMVFGRALSDAEMQQVFEHGGR